MQLGLTHKAAVIAGASSGIGFAIARAFAREGAKIAICSRDLSRIQKAAHTIQTESSAMVIAKAMDVTKKSDIDAWMGLVIEPFGVIHICVTNTGGTEYAVFANE